MKPKSKRQRPRSTKEASGETVERLSNCMLDVLACLKALTPEERGRVLEACLELNRAVRRS